MMPQHVLVSGNVLVTTLVWCASLTLVVLPLASHAQAADFETPTYRATLYYTSAEDKQCTGTPARVLLKDAASEKNMAAVHMNKTSNFTPQAKCFDWGIYISGVGLDSNATNGNTCMNYVFKDETCSEVMQKSPDTTGNCQQIEEEGSIYKYKKGLCFKSKPTAEDLGVSSDAFFDLSVDITSIDTNKLKEAPYVVSEKFRDAECKTPYEQTVFSYRGYYTLILERYGVKDADAYLDSKCQPSTFGTWHKTALYPSESEEGVQRGCATYYFTDNKCDEVFAVGEVLGGGSAQTDKGCEYKSENGETWYEKSHCALSKPSPMLGVQMNDLSLTDNVKLEDMKSAVWMASSNYGSDSTCSSQPTSVSAYTVDNFYKFSLNMQAPADGKLCVPYPTGGYGGHLVAPEKVGSTCLFAVFSDAECTKTTYVQGLTCSLNDEGVYEKQTCYVEEPTADELGPTFTKQIDPSIKLEQVPYIMQRKFSDQTCTKPINHTDNSLRSGEQFAQLSNGGTSPTGLFCIPVNDPTATFGDKMILSREIGFDPSTNQCIMKQYTAPGCKDDAVAAQTIFTGESCDADDTAATYSAYTCLRSKPDTLPAGVADWTSFPKKSTLKAPKYIEDLKFSSRDCSDVPKKESASFTPWVEKQMEVNPGLQGNGKDKILVDNCFTWPGSALQYVSILQSPNGNGCLLYYHNDTTCSEDKVVYAQPVLTGECSTNDLPGIGGFERVTCMAEAPAQFFAEAVVSLEGVTSQTFDESKFIAGIAATAMLDKDLIEVTSVKDVSSRRHLAAAGVEVTFIIKAADEADAKTLANDIVKDESMASKLVENLKKEGLAVTSAALVKAEGKSMSVEAATTTTTTMAATTTTTTATTATMTTTKAVASKTATTTAAPVGASKPTSGALSHSRVAYYPVVIAAVVSAMLA